MGDTLRNLALIAGLTAIALGTASYGEPAVAQAGKKAPASENDKGNDPEKAATLVQQIFDGGIKAYNVGKYEEALRAFEATIRTGMRPEKMPRVLYYRGLTFRKLGKPGFAVSDLTSALWLKGGLSEAERADAIKNRALAYHESGVSEVPPVPQSSYAQAPALPGNSPSSAPSSAMAGVAISNAPAATTTASSSSSTMGGIGNFFSNLFGSSSGSESESAPSTTASIGTSTPAISGWGATTEVVPHNDTSHGRAPEIGAPYVTQVASVGEPGRGAVPPPAASGDIRLQVASVRSRSEAEALAGLLVGRHADQLGGRRPEVDQTVIGSMGTFYRVRVGPYASNGEPAKLCNELRADGFDCLIITE